MNQLSPDIASSTEPKSEPVYYLAIPMRWLHDGNAKLHIVLVDGLKTSFSLCHRQVFAPVETCVVEDRLHPDLCLKCRDTMDWEKVRGKEKEYMDL